MRDLDSTDAEIEDYSDVLKALNNVLSELKNLKPDARKTLLQTVATFFKIELTELGNSRQVMQTSGDNVTNITALPSFSEDRSMSPKEFIFEKQPQTDVEKVACLAYYLAHFRQMPHFKTVNLSKLNTEAAQVKFSNAALAVNNATKSGYLASATKGHKQLSAVGEIYVQALPDRSAAQEAMKKARPRKKSTRRVKKVTKGR